MEPDRRVAVEAALHPDVAPFQRFNELMIAVCQRIIEAEIDNGSDDATHQVGNEESLASVLQVVEVCAFRSPFIEVAGLEKEETHEEEAPTHHLYPPVLILLSAEGHDVKRHHSDDANAAKDVEGVISLFHKDPSKPPLKGEAFLYFVFTYFLLYLPL